MSTLLLKRPEGDVSYDDTRGSGRVVVLVPGMGDLRQSTRFLQPMLRDAGYRVIRMDLRGLGESSTTFEKYAASDVGDDIVALLESLDITNAIVLGNSMTAASAVWAAAEAPERVSGIILTGPFVRDVPVNFLLSGLLAVLFWRPWGAAFWRMWFKSLYKTNPPPDLDEYATQVVNNIREPGRLEAVQAMVAASKAACEARIPEVRAKTVVLMGSLDPDFPKPAEEAEHVATVLHGRVEMVPGAGHYPHIEYPEVVVKVLQEFS